MANSFLILLASLASLQSRWGHNRICVTNDHKVNMSTRIVRYDDNFGRTLQYTVYTNVDMQLFCLLRMEHRCLVSMDTDCRQGSIDHRVGHMHCWRICTLCRQTLRWCCKQMRARYKSKSRWRLSHGQCNGAALKIKTGGVITIKVWCNGGRGWLPFSPFHF